MFEVKVVGILFNAFGLWEDLKLLCSLKLKIKHCGVDSIGTNLRFDLKPYEYSIIGVDSCKVRRSTAIRLGCGGR